MRRAHHLQMIHRNMGRIQCGHVILEPAIRAAACSNSHLPVPPQGLRNKNKCSIPFARGCFGRMSSHHSLAVVGFLLTRSRDWSELPKLYHMAGNHGRNPKWSEITKGVAKPVEVSPESEPSNSCAVLTKTAKSAPFLKRFAFRI